MKKILLLIIALGWVIALQAVNSKASAGDQLQFRSSGHVLLFNKDGFTAAGTTHALKVSFVHARGVTPVGMGDSTTTGNAMPLSAGMPKQPVDKTPLLKQVTYNNLWKGVTLTYKASPQGVLESTYRLTPDKAGRVDASQIGLRYNRDLSLDGNGNLVITAISEPGHKCSDGNTNSYTSARLLTQTTFTQAYGRIEARMKLPHGAGVWPAFWMLGKNIGTAGWPSCGEMDIMENVPQLGAGTIDSTLHMPQLTNSTADWSTGAGFTLPDNASISDDYHVYGIIWSPGKISFYVDDYTKPFVTKTVLDTTSGGGKWVYTQPAFILLNLAVGGAWPGPPDNTITWPQKMYVDYVHVFTAQAQ